MTVVAACTTHVLGAIVMVVADAKNVADRS
jgi:hypothetical protein